MNVNWVVIERLKSMAVSGCDQTGWLDMDALARFSHEGFASLVVLDVLREQRDVLQDVVGTALVAGRQPCYACVLRRGAGGGLRSVWFVPLACPLCPCLSQRVLASLHPALARCLGQLRRRH